MRYAEALQRQSKMCLNLAVLGILILCLCATGLAQTSTDTDLSKVPGFGGLNKYPGLLPEFGRLFDKFQRDVQFPAARSHSDLLPLLPASTTFYLAVPNYGDAAHQSLAIFREELKQSTPLHDWWTSGEMRTLGPKIEDAIDKFSTASGYLGNEIVVSAAVEGRQPSFVIIADARKPGLKPYLEQTLLVFPKPTPNIRIMDAQQLELVSKAENSPSSDTLTVLVRPDYVLASTNLATLRSFSTRLTSANHEFVATPFAQRILQSYETGVTAVGAIDLQKLVGLVPHDPSFAMLENSGFADVKYFVWEHKMIGGKTVSQSEISFTGPRHGIAAWIGAPASLGSLDFVSPKSIMAASLVLNDPPKMLDDIAELNPNALAPVAQMEQGLGISIRNDILAQLMGELTIEVDSATPPQPVWKAILRVKDATRLQQTLSAVMTATHVETTQYEDGGITYHVVRVPSPKGVNEFAYAFVKDYLVIGSSTDAVGDAVERHQSGDSLGKSSKFLAALPPGHSGLSALFYQNSSAMMAMRLQQLSPELANALSHTSVEDSAAVVTVYGGPNAISEASASPALDAGVVLVGAAIAIPNLLRSRVAANEASAVGTLRTLNTAEVTYSSSYPDRGFAADLATLGPGPAGSPRSEDHAGLLDATLATPDCTAGKWCAKSGYNFMVKAFCGLGSCRDFVALATPASPQTGSRSFCSTSDGLIRYQILPPLTRPISLSQCKAWTPLQ